MERSVNFRNWIQFSRILSTIIDDFDVGSIQDLNGVDKLELWTDGKGLGSGLDFSLYSFKDFIPFFFPRWNPEYVQLTDQKTGDVDCFIVEQYL